MEKKQKQNKLLYSFYSKYFVLNSFFYCLIILTFHLLLSIIWSGALFFKTNFGYCNSANEITINNVEQNAMTNVFILEVGLGFTIFSNNHIGIEALAKYNYASSNTTLIADGNTTTSTSITHVFDLSVGLQVYFTRQ